MRTSHSLAVAAASVAIVLVAPTARANGRFPAAQHLIAHGNSIALRSTFGFLVSDDAGGSFHYLCEEALGYGDRGFLDPPFVYDAQSRVYVGLTDQLHRVDATRCDAPTVDAFTNLDVGDLDASDDGTVVIAAVTRPDGTSLVVRSDDAGAHFSTMGTGMPAFTLTTLEMARSDSRTVYFTGYGADRVASVLVSHDGGATITALPFPTDRIDDAWVAGIDPVAAGTVYIRARMFPVSADGGTTRPTALMRSTDGGMHWTEVTRTRGSMLGFAIDSSGRSVWVGGPGGDGIMGSTDGGDTWTARASAAVQCLRWSNGTLYVCGDWVSDGYAIARSTDGGRTLEPMLRFDQVDGSFACSAGTVEASACATRWSDIRRQFFALDGGVGDAAANADATADAGALPDAPNNSDACANDDCGSHHAGCDAQPTRSGAMPGMSALALMAAGWLLRRRRLAYTR